MDIGKKVAEKLHLLQTHKAPTTAAAAAAAAYDGVKGSQQCGNEMR